MIFTNLSYMQVGGILGTLSTMFFIVVVTIRYILAFRNYIYNGNFGDFEKSAFGEIMEHGNFFSVYAFTGYHPGTLTMDAIVFALFSILLIPLWGAYIICGLFLLLAKTIRKRIAAKQEFIAKLDGTHKSDD